MIVQEAVLLICLLIMDAEKNCTAEFSRVTPPPATGGSKQLTVTITGGPGAGEVNSSETLPTMQCLNSINASTNCSVAYATGSNVTLKASPFSPNNSYTWTGCDQDLDVNGCVVQLSQDKKIGVAFYQVTGPFTLDVSVNDLSAGFVTGDPINLTIQCGAGAGNTICSESYPINTSVHLTATPATGKLFTGWSGSCTQGMSNAAITSNSIQFTMTQNISCDAEFAPPANSHTVSVTIQGTGGGVVKTFYDGSSSPFSEFLGNRKKSSL